MKNKKFTALILFFAAPITLGAILLPSQIVRAETGENLVSNPGFENSTDSWTQDRWGENTAVFSHEAEGINGSSKSAKLTLSAHTDGDAKWFFDPVAVQPGQTYIYHDQYRSDVTSLLVVMSLDADDNPTYFYLGEAPAAANWEEISFMFQAPDDSTRLTVFHLLNLVGTLSIDETFMASYTPTYTGNLIPNSGLENGTASWIQDRWGNNSASFTHENTGHDSPRSVKVTVSNYVDGDAKWHFAPVPVEASKEYTFSDHYQSDVTSLVVAMSLDAAGTPTYFFLGALPPSADWQAASFEFSTPANSHSLSIFHLLNVNGWLQTDNHELRAAASSPPTAIPNPSLETVSSANPNLPASWSHSSWGVNSPTYGYMTDGHSGSRSVKLTMNDHESGDAKWVYAPQALVPGGDYRFRVWYKTNVIPEVVVRFFMDDGSDYYFGLPDPEPSGSDWQEYSAVFSVPENAGAATIFLFLTGNGWVQTDDYSLEPYTYTGFDEGRVTITFDDGFETNITTALPVLEQYDFLSTYCYATAYVDGQPGQPENVQAIVAAGHEPCSHTINHFDLAQIDAASRDQELAGSQEYLVNILAQPVTSVSTPYGSYNSAVIDNIHNYYQAHRTTNEGYNSADTLDPLRLFTQNMMATTALDQFQGWVNKALVDKTWLILTYHEIVSNDAQLDIFDTRKEDFDAQMAWLAGTGIKVQTLKDVLAEVSN